MDTDDEGVDVDAYLDSCLEHEGDGQENSHSLTMSDPIGPSAGP